MKERILAAIEAAGLNPDTDVLIDKQQLCTYYYTVDKKVLIAMELNSRDSVYISKAFQKTREGLYIQKEQEQ